MRELIVKTEGTTEPVTVAELRNFVGYPGTDSSIETVIENLGKSARLRLEQYCGRNFIEKTMILTESNVKRSLQLPFGPIYEIESVKVYDSYGVLDETLTADDDYYLIGEFDKYCKFESWFDGAYVKIEYTAGYGENTYDLPQALKDAILMQSKYDFDHRSRSDAQVITSEVMNLLTPYRWSFL
jgi:uncharacterized phiE125 gp8 family phage protein